jgi:hypothetical protein
MSLILSLATYPGNFDIFKPKGWASVHMLLFYWGNVLRGIFEVDLYEVHWASAGLMHHNLPKPTLALCALPCRYSGIKSSIWAYLIRTEAESPT